MSAPYGNEKRPTKEELENRFEEAERAIKEGRTLGPFKTASAAMRALNQRARRARHSR